MMNGGQRWVFYTEFVKAVETLIPVWWPTVSRVEQVPDFMIPFVKTAFSQRFRVPMPVLEMLGTYSLYCQKQRELRYGIPRYNEVKYKEMPRSTSNTFKAVLWYLFQQQGVPLKKIPSHIEMVNITMGSKTWWNLLPENLRGEEKRVVESVMA